MLLPYYQQLAIIAALLMFSVALSPVAIAYSLKVSQN
jgi:heme exporter protein B